MTPEGIEADFWAHRYFDKPEGEIEDVDEEFDQAAILEAIDRGEWDEV